MLFSKDTVASIEKLTLRLGGMRLLEKYEIVCGGQDAEISDWWEKYVDGKLGWELQRRAVRPAGAVLELLNECRVLRWDGFSGPQPEGLTDGTSFTLEAWVNGGRRIYADGSENFPEHFHEFQKGLELLLEQP